MPCVAPQKQRSSHVKVLPFCFLRKSSSSIYFRTLIPGDKLRESVIDAREITRGSVEYVIAACEMSESLMRGHEEFSLRSQQRNIIIFVITRHVSPICNHICFTSWRHLHAVSRLLVELFQPSAGLVSELAMIRKRSPSG